MTEKSKMTFATIAGLCLAVMIGLGAGWMAEHYPIFKRETPIAEETAPSSPPAMLATVEAMARAAYEAHPDLQVLAYCYRAELHMGRNQEIARQ